MKYRVYILVLICSLFILVGCSKKESKDLKVRIGYFPNITHAQAILGKENGFKAALAGTNVELKQFNAGSSEIEALLAEEIDIGYIGPGPAINGFVKSKGQLQIIAGVCDGGAIIISRNDVEVKNIKELSGKKVAVPQFGNTQHVVLKELLEANGLKETTKGGTVEIVQADNPDIKALFDRKIIDAAFVPEPWGSRLVEEVKAKIVMEYDKVWRDGKYPVTVLIGRTEFIKEHPEIVEKFIRQHVELTEEIKSDIGFAKKNINNEIKKVTGKSLSSGIMDSSFKRLLITNNVDKKAIKEMTDFMKKLDIIKDNKSIEDIFNFTILNKVLKEKGYKIIE